MKNYLLLLFFVFSNFYSTQEKKSFKIDDIIYVRKSNASTAHEFLKSRYFDYVGSSDDYKEYALSLNKTTGRAKMFVYKYTDNKLKILEGGDATHLTFIRNQLKPYKKRTDFEDEWVETTYNYKGYFILLRENDQINKYELYID